MMRKTVVIDCFPESVRKYRFGYAVVAIDVIRATTTAVTGVSQGRGCFPVPSLEAAYSVFRTLEDPLLVGELSGNKPDDFHLNNSPADLSERTDLHRPMILLSSSGTRLICESGNVEAAYVACLRNYSAQIAHLVMHHPNVALIGAGTRGEFRIEDKLCCAWIAEGLRSFGYQPQDENTAEIIESWGNASLDEIIDGNSAKYLRRSGQHRDLEFVLSHVDDLFSIYAFKNGQVTVSVDSQFQEVLSA